MLILFDTLETLFSLDRIKSRFRKKGLSLDLMDLWLARLGEAAMSSTIAGKYVPFNILAPLTLKQVFAQKNIHDRYVDEVLLSLQEIEPWDDASDCLRSLRSDGHRLVAMTNSDRMEARRLLQRTGLWRWFERLYSAETVKACKPHHAMYEQLFHTMFAGPYECCMVSAYASDILGAESLGMNTVYVNRVEKQWPFPDDPSGFIVSNLREIPKIIAEAFGKPAALSRPDRAGPWSKSYGEA